MVLPMVVKVMVSIKRGDCTVSNTLSEMGLDFTTVKVNIGITESKHLIILKGGSAKGLINSLRSKGLGVYVIDDKTLWIKGPSCSSCKTLASLDLMINDIHSTRDRAIYNVWLPSRNRIPKLIRYLKRSNLDFKIVKVEDIGNMELTERQFEALVLAYKRGLFNGSRKVSMTELAKELGVTPSTYSELLRKALKKVVKHYFDELI